MKDNEKGYQIFCHLKMAEQIFEQQNVCMFGGEGSCYNPCIFQIINENAFYFLENGSDSRFLMFLLR